MIKYSYDELNRLVREDNARFGTFTYRYDAAGNILSKTEYAFTFKDELGEALYVKEYSYRQHGWKDMINLTTQKKPEIREDFGLLPLNIKQRIKKR